MIEVKKIPADEWEAMKADAHISVFEELPGNERVDFALLSVLSKTQEIIQYITIREYDADSIHWYYGGSFPKYKGGMIAYRSTEAMLNWARDNYKRVSFLAANNNYAMLKFGIKNRFQIVGVRLVSNGLLLEHVLEFENKEAN